MRGVSTIPTPRARGTAAASFVSDRRALFSPPSPDAREPRQKRRGEPRPLPGQLQVRAHPAHRDRPRPAVALGAGGLPHRARVVRGRGRGRRRRALRRAARIVVGGAPPARLLHLEQRHRHPDVRARSARARLASLAASCAPEASAERRATMPARIKKTVESLVVPFLTFQLLACLVEASSPALASALAPAPQRDVRGERRERRRDAGAAVRRVRAGVDERHEPLQRVQLLDPAPELVPAGARVVARGAPRGGADAARRAALALALARAWAWASAGRLQRGLLPEVRHALGNFPYFLAGVFLCGDETYFAFRDDWATAGRRAGAATVTAAAVAACFFGLRSGAMCFDAWQWEAWKSAPYGDYLFVDAQTPQRDLGVAPLGVYRRASVPPRDVFRVRRCRRRQRRSSPPCRAPRFRRRPRWARAPCTGTFCTRPRSWRRWRPPGRSRRRPPGMG